MTTSTPFRLEPSFHEKPWGVTDLSPWFPPAAGKTGEVWFSSPAAGSLPLLVKFIFTSDWLSVQVHPDDGYAREREGAGGGKSEMWYVLRAEPGAQIAAGFREPLSKERLRQAALSGEIERLLRRFPVRSGQVVFLPPGTVHALGAGIAVCEIQQNNPITYRLYDYGRPRELHLEKAIDVSLPGPHPGPFTPSGGALVSSKHFSVERLDLQGEGSLPADPRFRLLVVLEGDGRLAGAPFAAGETWYAPPSAEPLPVAAPSRAVLLCARPAL